MSTSMPRAGGLLLWTAVLAAAASCETTVTDVPVPVATVDLTAARTTIDQGETVQLSATPRSESGRAMTARQVTWSSSNSAILSVDAIGLARGMSPGTATVTARSEGAENSVTITVRSTRLALTIDNLLVGPVIIEVNEQVVGTVDPLSTRVFDLPRQTTLTVGWDLVRQQTNTGTEVGEEVGGVFATEPTPGATAEYEIDNVVGSSTYFAPFITNNSTVSYLVGVNMGLPEENRCPCEVPAGGANVYIGYYELVPSSNVRAYASGSNYTGTFVFWDNFMANVAAGSGRLNLVSNLVPAQPITIRNDYVGGVSLNPGGGLAVGESVVLFSNAPLQVGVHDCGEPGTSGCIQDMYTLLPGRSYAVITHPSGPPANLTIVERMLSMANASAGQDESLSAIPMSPGGVLAPSSLTSAGRPQTRTATIGPGNEARGIVQPASRTSFGTASGVAVRRDDRLRR